MAMPLRPYPLCLMAVGTLVLIFIIFFLLIFFILILTYENYPMFSAPMNDVRSCSRLCHNDLPPESPLPVFRTLGFVEIKVLILNGLTFKIRRKKKLFFD